MRITNKFVPWAALAASWSASLVHPSFAVTPAATSAVAPTSVNLSSVDTLFGISKQGMAVTGGGVDTNGNAYDGAQLGTSITYNGASFNIPSPGPKTAVSSTVIPLPAGKFKSLSFLGLAVAGSQSNQAFVVKYTDGTTKTFSQSLSDWGQTPAGFSGETVVKTTTFKITSTGGTHANSYKLYGYTFTLDSTKTVSNVTLPANRHVVVIAMDLIPGSQTAASPTFNPLPGTFTTSQSVALASTTTGATIYFTIDGTTPTRSSHKFSTPFKVSATETVEAMTTATGFNDSAVVIAHYTINPSATPTATPKFSPAPGAYASATTVTLSDTTSGASIFFTTNGSTPTAESTKYTGPFKVSVTTTVKAIGIASGHTNSSVASGTYTIGTPPPSHLSYTVPPPLLIGNPVSLSPTVTGTVTSYSVGPSLPNGLSLNTTTGVISGKPTKVTAQANYTITAKNGSGSTSFALPLKVDSGPTVHLTATATTTTGAVLNYTWKTTDGTLLDTNGAEADWELPPGFGIHFAYVVVSDGRSGYSEGRVVVNTDTFGAPPVIKVESISPGDRASAYRAPLKVTAAPATADGNAITLTDSDAPTAVPDAITPVVQGNVLLADHNYAGMEDPFFGVAVRPTVSVTASQCLDNGDCPSPKSTGGFGEYAVTVADSGAAGSTETVTATSQASVVSHTFTLSSADFTAARTLGTLLLGNSAAPKLTAMTATFRSTSVGAFQLITPNPTGQPSDGYPLQNWFFSYPNAASKPVGVFDTKKSSCEYYLAVGAVTACDSSGHMTGAITFTDWQKQVQIDQFAVDGVKTVKATYVNVVDLNLTRVHHSIQYSNGGQTATYVCNHLGPVDSTGKPISVNLPASTMTAAQQAAVNTAVANAVAGKNLVACVAMDYISTPINDFAQFTRFLVFGPSGQLLQSVNLDGRGEKFVPGTCVACHGGDSYSGKYPDNGSGVPDIGAHFLPYDAGNFAFSTASGFTEANQEEAIYQLNQNILDTDATASTTNLIAGWYRSGHTLDKNYVPPAWSSHPNTYKQVVARSCRTCHAALPNFDWDAQGPGDSKSTPDGKTGLASFPADVCDNAPNSASGLTGTQDMPASKVTFDRMWDTRGTSADQIATLTALYHSLGYLPSNTCTLRIAPH